MNGTGFALQPIKAQNHADHIKTVIQKKQHNGGKTMKTKLLNKILVISGIVAILGFAATSFAGWGRGGGGYCGGQGYGYNQRGYAPQSYQNNFSDEEIAKFSEQRQVFFEETGELRQTIYQKELELNAEMAKQEPDAKKAVALQKEISDLQSQLDQKRVEHRIKMQKENPEFFSGRGYGYGSGGRWKGRGMSGFGNRGGGGGCWQ